MTDTKGIEKLFKVFNNLRDEKTLRVFLSLSKSNDLTLEDMRKDTGLNTVELNHRIMNLGKAHIVSSKKKNCHNLTNFGRKIALIVGNMEKDPDVIEVVNLLKKIDEEFGTSMTKE